MKTNKKYISILEGILLPVIVIVFWYITTNSGRIPQSILPKIGTVWTTFIDMCRSGELWGDMSVSLLRVLKGYLIAAVTGVLLGTSMGMSKHVKNIIQPTITTIRQIPIMAWIPLLILWCGIGEASKVVVIVLAAIFPIVVNTESGIAQTPASYIEVAKLYKLGKVETFLRVYLPHALPQIQTGLKLGLGVSWMAVVAAELIASTSGIGYKMSYARTLMQSDVLIVAMIVVGVVGVLIDKFITILFGVLTPWNRIKTR